MIDRLVIVWCAATIAISAPATAVPQEAQNAPTADEAPPPPPPRPPPPVVWKERNEDLISRSDCVQLMLACNRAPPDGDTAAILDAVYSRYAQRVSEAVAELERTIDDLITRRGRVLAYSDVATSTAQLQSIFSEAAAELANDLAALCGRESREVLHDFVVSVASRCATPGEIDRVPRSGGIDLFEILRAAEAEGAELHGWRGPPDAIERIEALEALEREYRNAIGREARVIFDRATRTRCRRLLGKRGAEVTFPAVPELRTAQLRWDRTNESTAATLNAIIANHGVAPLAMAKWTERTMRTFYPSLVPQIDIADAVIASATHLGGRPRSRPGMKERIERMHVDRAAAYAREASAVCKWLATAPKLEHGMLSSPPPEVQRASRRTVELQRQFAEDLIASVDSAIVRAELEDNLRRCCDRKDPIGDNMRPGWMRRVQNADGTTGFDPLAPSSK